MQLLRKKLKRLRKRLKRPLKQQRSKPKRMQQRLGRRLLRKQKRQELERKLRSRRERNSRTMQVVLKTNSRIFQRNAVTDRTLSVTKRSRKRITPLPTLRRSST